MNTGNTIQVTETKALHRRTVMLAGLDTLGFKRIGSIPGHAIYAKKVGAVTQKLGLSVSGYLRTRKAGKKSQQMKNLTTQNVLNAGIRALTSNPSTLQQRN